MSKGDGAETVFSQQVAAFFHAQISTTPWAEVLKVKERVKILKDLTIGKDRDGQWRLIAGFQQQDIVFYSYAIPMPDFKSKVVRVDKYDKTDETPVIIPLAVCELKIGAAMNTHALITYASISAQLKSIFPHCAYFFVIDSNQERGLKPETILRHTKGFDRVFVDWVSEKEHIWQALLAHFNYLVELNLLP